jgi:type VI secretion system protein ImpG
MAIEATEREFLIELEALEKFRISYTAQYPAVPLSHDDPDVRRLIEALAFFTARTRIAANRSLDESVQRIVRQHFPALLAPTPAMCMLHAEVGPQFCDSAELPKGAEVVCRRRGMEPGQADSVFRFRTMASMRILPINIMGVDMAPMRNGNVRLTIRVKANSAHNQPLSQLAFYINHLDDLRSSLTVAYELQKHLRGASVVYEQKPSDDAAGYPCDIEISGPRSSDDVPDPFQSPLQKARLKARFPQLDLFLHVSGLRPPRNWQYVTLRLELSPDWPRALRLTSDSLELHTIPMLNLQRDLASPIEVDGTKDRYLVRHPDDTGGFVPLMVMAAYRPTKNGFVPLPPGIVGVLGDSFEIMTDGLGADRRVWLLPRIQSAFTTPERLSVDTYWHQPALRGVLASELQVGLNQQYVEGINWRCSGAIQPYADAVLDSDREAQLQLVSLKTQRFLEYPDVLFLLRAYGTHLEPHTAKLVAALKSVKVSNKPAGKGTALAYIYELEFGTLEPTDKPRLSQFCAWLLDLLSSWSVEEVSEVVASAPNLDHVTRQVRM